MRGASEWFRIPHAISTIAYIVEMARRAFPSPRRVYTCAAGHPSQPRVLAPKRRLPVCWREIAVSQYKNARTMDAQPDRRHENKVLLLLTLIIGAVVGLVVVAFILLTENLGARLYPAGGAIWRRLLIPVAGALAAGYFLVPLFSQRARQRDSADQDRPVSSRRFISFRTVLGKFSLCSVTLASGIALGREGPVGAGRRGHRLGAGPPAGAQSPAE